MNQKIVSELDNKNLSIIRENVTNFIRDLSFNHDLKGNRVLDIAPQKYLGVKEFFKNSKVSTLDIDPNSGADYICDICEINHHLIPDETFDLVVCTEVLEHVNNPFLAVQELHRITKKGGFVGSSTPFNFRIHGPLPDNWRFTIHGLNILFQNFEMVEISELEDPERNLMPIHYTICAIK